MIISKNEIKTKYDSVMEEFTKSTQHGIEIFCSPYKVGDPPSNLIDIQDIFLVPFFSLPIQLSIKRQKRLMKSFYLVSESSPPNYNQGSSLRCPIGKLPNESTLAPLSSCLTSNSNKILYNKKYL